MPEYGLIGHPLGHSFSKQFFHELYQSRSLAGYSYELYDLADINQFPSLARRKGLDGVNVTIPYKSTVIPFLDELDEAAARADAVNTIVIQHGVMKGYNTDITGFRRSVEPLVKGRRIKALVFGTGGSSRAVQYVLNALDIEYLVVSRYESQTAITYSSVSGMVMDEYRLLVNCTPLGMYPNVKSAVNIPYGLVTDKHIAFDLVYNPAETLFLKRCRMQKATVVNGAAMLKFQAEAAFEIWQDALAVQR